MVGYLCLFSSRNPGMDRRGREAERGGGFTDTFMPDLLSGLGELGVASCRAPLQGSHGMGSKNIEMQVSPRG